MIACQCTGVTDAEIRSEVRLGATTVELVAVRCGASARCGGCRPTVEDVVADEFHRSQAAPAVPH